MDKKVKACLHQDVICVLFACFCCSLDAESCLSERHPAIPVCHAVYGLICRLRLLNFYVPITIEHTGPSSPGSYKNGEQHCPNLPTGNKSVNK